MSALFKATAIVLVVVGISVLIILPVHYPTHQMPIGFGAVAFVLTWYLVMFVVLNVSGS